MKHLMKDQEDIDLFSPEQVKITKMVDGNRECVQGRGLQSGGFSHGSDDVSADYSAGGLAANLV